MNSGRIIPVLLVQACFAAVCPASLIHAEDCNGNGVEDALDVQPGPLRIGANRLPHADALLSRDLDGDEKPEVILLTQGGCGRLCPPASLSLYRNDGSGEFSPTLDHTFASPISLALLVADLNGDASNDIAGTSSRGTVEVLLSAERGQMVIPPGSVYEVPTGARATIAIDADADGDLDLAVATSFHVALLLNHGDGTFAGARTTILGSGPTSLVAGDFNTDAKLDLATANESSGSVSVLLGDGEGNFPSIRNYASGGEGPNSLVTGDFDGDRSLDLGTAGSIAGGGAVSVVFNAGDGSFGPDAVHATAAVSPHSLRAEDTDRDGDHDLYASGNGGWVHLRNSGAGAFETFDHVLEGGNAVTVALADLDGVGNPDWAVGSSLGLMVLTDGRPATSYPLPIQRGLLLASDLDGDGLDDLVLEYGQDTALILNEPGVGLPAPPVAMNLPGGFASPKTADLNGDGATDFVFANPGAISVSLLLNQRNGTFSPPVEVFAGRAPTLVAPADFDQDGNVDVATLNGGSDDASILLGKGDGTLLPAVRYPVGRNTGVALLTVDLSGDGHPDLAALNGSYGTPRAPEQSLSVLIGNGDGSFQRARNYLVGRPVIAVDLNGDGALDLAGPNNVSTDDSQVSWMSVLINQGNGTFEAAEKYRLFQGCGAYSVATADFDADGRQDLAAGNPCGGAISLLLGAGGGNFAAAREEVVKEGTNVNDFQTADLNGDGHADLAAAVAGTVYVLAGNGDGTFGRPLELVVAENLEEEFIEQPLSTLDADLDGDLDIAGVVWVYGEQLTSRVFCLIQSQDATSWRLVFQDTVPGWSSVMVAELGHSHLADLAVFRDSEADGLPDTVEVLLNHTRSPASRDGNHDGIPDECRVQFHRGDPNGDGRSDIADAISTLEFLFLGGDPPACRESADIENDGAITITDPVSLLGFLFRGGPSPAAPGPPEAACGPDPDPAGAAGDLGCERYEACHRTEGL